MCSSFFFYNIIVWKISECVDRVHSGYDVMQLRIMCKKWISPSLEWNESVYEKLGDDGDDTKQRFQTKVWEFLQVALKQMHLSKYRRLNWMRQLICLYAVVISKPACGWGKKNEKGGKAYVWVDYTVLTVLDTSYPYGGALKQNITVVFFKLFSFLQDAKL